MSMLDGLQVLDFSHALSGPTCTNMLGMLGARIVKVEPRGSGDDFRHYTEHAGEPGMSIPFAAANSGKESIAIDLKKPEAAEVVRRLVERADVLVENFRPGTMARLGLGYDAIRDLNPRIVYCSISGFGQTGPFRDWTAYDNIVQAMSGLSRANADPDKPPQNVPFPIIDIFSGYLGAIGILAALRKRDRTGDGEHVDASMLEASLKLMSTAISHYLEDGSLPVNRRNRGFRLVATSDTYATRDGHIAIAANHQHQVAALFDLLGHPEMIADPRFADHAARVANFHELKQWLTEQLAERSAEELEPPLAERGVPVARVRNLGQILEHPALIERRPLRRSRLGESDKTIATMGPGLHFASVSDHEDAGPVPALGAHTDEILRDLGFGQEDVARFRRLGIL
jgi:crotonobetainyl-CoA:carnitine CoA-transferase CaiB-like acyl-CoA transferase